MNFKSIIIAVSMTLSACGQDEGTCPDTIVDQNTYPDAGDCAYQNSLPPPTPTTNGITIHGSVSAAFSIEVDGETYPDAESYFGAALDELRAKADAAGYEDYSVKLDAVVGFSDLTNGMTVYIQTMSNRGYQGTTTIGRDNNFSLELPEDAAGDYQIRANKRVSMLLSAEGKETVLFCYNLSANAVSVPFDVADKPVILRSFSTTLTKYACESDEVKPTLPIPDNSTPDTDVPAADTTQDPNKLYFMGKIPFGEADEIQHQEEWKLHIWNTDLYCENIPCSVLVDGNDQAYWYVNVKPELVNQFGWLYQRVENAQNSIDNGSISQ